MKTGERVNISTSKGNLKKWPLDTGWVKPTSEKEKRGKGKGRALGETIPDQGGGTGTLFATLNIELDSGRRRRVMAGTSSGKEKGADYKI